MLDALRQIVQDVGTASSFRHALDLTVARVAMILDTDVCSIYLLDRASGRFSFVASEGRGPDVLGTFSLAPGEGLVGLVVERAEPINLGDATRHRRYRQVPELGDDDFSAFLGVPIIHNRVVLGAMVVEGHPPRRFSEQEVAFVVTLAAQFAGIVAHADATGEIRHLFGDDTHAREANYQGVPGAPGIGIGTAVVVKPMVSLDSVPDRHADDTEAEIEIFDQAIRSVRKDLERINEELSKSLQPEERELFEAYLHILDDAALAGEVRQRIEQGQWAQGALRQVILEHTATFEKMPDSYLRERSADVRDLGQRVLAYLQDISRGEVVFPDDTILVSDEVTASMMAELPREKLRGIVSVRGSSYSHGAILAQALGIPTVMGVVEMPIFRVDGQPMVVDGHYGEVFVSPGALVRAQYDAFAEEEGRLAEELDSLKELPSVTRDGHRLNLWVNVGLVSEISRSLDRGAEGIGLFRTEVPFATRDRFPTEEDQRSIYREHMEAFEPRPVTMRTLDIGGDKSLSYFPITEENPFLGWRGIRVTLDHPEIFLGQVRAMIKANAGLEGVLRIMLPMVSSLEEVHEARALIDRAYREVGEEGFAVKPPQVGVMIEVPAAVYLTRDLARDLDFLAVGSNDLTQYMLAVDRNNSRVAGLFQELHPSVLIALREIAKSCHAEGKPVGICGELAGTPEGALLCVGMGYDVLSMNATNLPRVKLVIRSVSLRDCRRILARVLRMRSTAEIVAFVRDQLVGIGLERLIPHHEVPELF